MYTTALMGLKCIMASEKAVPQNIHVHGILGNAETTRMEHKPAVAKG